MDDSEWTRWAVQRIREAHGQVETPLVEFKLPDDWGVRLVFKDESKHSSGSLKHRLAASLMMFGVCNADIRRNSVLVDASSGSTAVSEAFFARVLGLRFVAVVPRQTSPSKLALIEQMGGKIEFVDDPGRVREVAEKMGHQPDHVFLDQFGNASVRTKWRFDNLASALFGQLEDQGFGEPDWIVVGAGTGGTSATLARFIRYTGRYTKVAVADPEGSAYYLGWLHQDRDQVGHPSRIEGIGRQTVEASFQPQLVDTVIPVPDAWSVAGMRVLQDAGIGAGASTGTNLIACLRIIESMRAQGRTGLVAPLICDSADRYRETYDQAEWLAGQGIELGDAQQQLAAYLSGGPTPLTWSVGEDQVSGVPSAT